MMKLSQTTESDFSDWVEMGLLLWPDYSEEELQYEFKSILESDSQTSFLSRSDRDEAIGFINVSLRSDYVPGAHSSPVGYVEGIYIQPAFRKQGIAKSLLQEAEKWSLSKGCTEIGSDAELKNSESHQFHEKIGFKEADRLVCYIKHIKA